MAERVASPPLPRRAATLREAARAKERKRARQDKVPTWRGAFIRAMAAAVLLLVVMLVFKLGKPNQVIALFPIVLLLYVPISYYTDQWIYKRRKRSEGARGGVAAMSAPDVRAFTVGAVQENCYIVRADSSATRAVIVDPGDEAERLLAAATDLGVEHRGDPAHAHATSITSARSPPSRATPERPSTARRSSARCSPT